MENFRTLLQKMSLMFLILI